VAEERIRRHRGREKPSAGAIRMRHQRASKWGLSGLIAAAVLLSPVLAFLMALVVDIVIGFLNDGRVPALLVLVAAGAMTFRGNDLTTPATPDTSRAPQHGFPGSHPYTCVGRWAALVGWLTGRLMVAVLGVGTKTVMPRRSASARSGRDGAADDGIEPRHVRQGHLL
jgi:hypothetical protein